MVNHDPFENLIIRASAGTGKTFALSNRYLRLLVSGVDCESILATTFSRKGAGEILDRIVGRLSAAALDPKLASQLASELGTEIDQQGATGILHRLMRNLHRLEISTLDSFFNRVAKAFSLELGLPPSWEIVDEQQMMRLEDQSIQEVLQEEEVDTLLHMLSKGEATRRVASMIRDVVYRVYQVFRESGPEPWDRLQPQGSWLAEDQLDLLIEQMRGFEIRQKNMRSHWEKMVQYAQASDWIEFVRDNTSLQNVMDGKLKFGQSKLPPEMLDIYEKVIPHCRAVVSHQLIARNQATRDLLSGFGKLLEQTKDQTGQLRFDDVTERLKKFVAMWDTDRFAFRLDHQIQHLLLDEFQDTSPAQWHVVEPFARKVVEQGESHRSFFCVGDMKQAIFGWRGGVAEIFDLVDQSLPNLDRDSLAKSYRSAPEVIDLVNMVFGQVEKYQCKDDLINEAIQQWAQWFHEHSTEKSSLAGHVSVEIASECDSLAKRVQDRKDRLRNDNVIESTVLRVRELARNLPLHLSIGVLVRTNRDVARLIFKLRQRGVQASEEGGSGLTDSVAVELILSALQLADHPGDGLARFHLSHSPLAKIFGLLPESDQNQKENLVAAQKGAAQLRKRLVHEGFGPVVESLARQLVEFATARETKRLQQLTRIAYDHSEARKWQLRPSNFVQFVRDEIKVTDETSARVRVMTIHKSKGLEFDAVVLPFMLSSEGWAGHVPDVVVGRQSPTAPIEIASRYMGEKLRRMLPDEFRKVFDDDRQRNVRESMCVLYVALTRAVHSVYVVLSHGAKPDHMSPAGILMATLDVKREEGIQYQAGNAKWYESVAAPAQEDDPYRLEPFYLPVNISFDAEGISTTVRSGRGLPTQVPSKPTDANHVHIQKLFESRSDPFEQLRGMMLRGCFSQIRWLDESTPGREELVTHLRTLDASVAHVDRYIADFYNAIEHTNITKLFSRIEYQRNYLMELPADGGGSIDTVRLEVESDRKFVVASESGLCEGVFDRLVLIYRGDLLVGVDVIVIKADRSANGDVHDQVQQFRAQVSAYREAASAVFCLELEQVSTRLVLSGSGQVVHLDVAESRVPAGRTARQQSPKRRPPTPKPKYTKPKVESQPVRKEMSNAALPKKQQTLWDDA